MAEQLELILFASNDSDENCQALVSKVICNHFFPVCGGQDGVHRPISVCSEECLFVADNCTETWTASQGILLESSLGAINCSNTDSHLNGLSGCCSGLNITITSGMLIGASLSEPHTSELVLKNLLRSMYVYINFRDVRSGTVLIRIYLIACSKISINQQLSLAASWPVST